MKKMLFMLVAVMSFSAQAKDVTRLVIANTDLDERVASACAGMCGNRGASKLQSVSIQPLRGSIYRVEARAVAEYHEYAYPTEVFGVRFGGASILKYTVNTVAYGDLDINTCYVTITRVDIVGDDLGIANGVKSIEGTRHYVANCKQFI